MKRSQRTITGRAGDVRNTKFASGIMELPDLERWES
jgi:hypothetical protein